MSIHFFNPREASHETLERTFVGRQGLLEEILEDLRRQAASRTRQHWLVRAPRGMGKTHLSALVYHRVRTDPELSAAYLPVWLPESDAYSIYSVGTLLVQVAEQLALELREHEPDESGALARRVGAVEGQGDDSILFEGMCEFLAQVATGRDRVLLVLMENLDALLDTLSAQRGRDEEGRLRAVLIEESSLLLFSTTPTYYHPALAERGRPLYGHLKERRLEAFSQEEVQEFLGRLASVAGDDGQAVRRAIADSRRLRVFHRLTGGNPRTIAMAFSAIRGASGLPAIVREMEALLDTQSPYFEARLAALAPRERAIVMAMGLDDTNLTIKEIAARTRLPARSLSTQVNRLEVEGVAAPVGGRGGKGTVYQLTDGLFRVWLQYRKGRGVLEPLVRFLALWHDQDELERTLADLEAASGEPAGALAAADVQKVVARQIEAAVRFARSEEGQRERRALLRDLDDARSTEVAEVEELVRDAVETGSAEPLHRGLALVRELGVTHPGEGDQAALELMDTTVLLDVLSADAALEILRRLEIALEGLPGSDPPVRGLACYVQGKLLERVGRHADAVAALDRAVTLFDDVGWLAAMALVGKGSSLMHAGRDEEALGTFDAVTARWAEPEDSQERIQLAMALVNKGSVLERIGRPGDAFDAYEQVVRRFGDAPEPRLGEGVARALIAMSQGRAAAGEHDEALRCLDEVLARFGDAEETVGQQQVARALVARGQLLRSLGRQEQERQAYDGVVERFGAASDTVLQGYVALALVGKGLSLGASGAVEEGVAALEEVVGRYGDSTLPPLRQHVSGALAFLGLLREMAGDSAGAVRDRQAAVDRFGGVAEFESKPWLALARAELARSRLAGGDAGAVRALLGPWFQMAVEQPLEFAPFLDDALDTVLGSGLPLEEIRTGVERIRDSGHEGTGETARFFLFVIDLVAAAESEAGGTHAQRWNEVRKRVPPELRQTVEERARSIIERREGKTAPASPPPSMG